MQREKINVNFDDFRCSHCLDFFWNEQKLVEHCKLHKDVEYKCGFCGKISYNKDTFYMHVLLLHRKKKYHEAETKYTCDICSKVFAKKANIKAHMLIHSSKYFNCKVFIDRRKY